MIVSMSQKTMDYNGGPNRVFGKTEDHGFLSVKKVKTHFLVK